MADPLERERRIGQLERDFRSAGLPLLSEDYSATEDVFTRAVPLLTLVLLGEVLGAIDLNWSLPANLAAIAGSYFFLLFNADEVASQVFWPTVVGVGWIILMTYISYRGIEISARVQYAQKHHSRPYAVLERLGIALGSLTHVVVSRGGLTVRAAHGRALVTALSPKRS